MKNMKLGTKKLKWDWDYLVHFAGGLAINAANLGLNVYEDRASWFELLMVGLAGVFVLAVFGNVREKIQHHWEPLSLHQRIEAWLWAFGGLLALPIIPIFI